MFISPVITHGLVTLALTVLQVATNDLRVGITEEILAKEIRLREGDRGLADVNGCPCLINV